MYHYALNCIESCTQIVAVDPKGSVLAQPEELNKEGEGFPYQVKTKKLTPTTSHSCELYLLAGGGYWL